MEGEDAKEFWRQQQTKAAAKGGSCVPHTLTISLVKGGHVSVKEGSHEEVRRCGSQQVMCSLFLYLQEGVVYELSMVVAHVREGWMEVPGNLVAHIRVSPFYHERKKVSLK